MKKVEIIFAALSILAVILELFLIPGGATLALLSFFTLSGIYLVFGFALFNNIQLRKAFDSNSYRGVGPVETPWSGWRGFWPFDGTCGNTFQTSVVDGSGV